MSQKSIKHTLIIPALLLFSQSLALAFAPASSAAPSSKENTTQKQSDSVEANSAQSTNPLPVVNRFEMTEDGLTVFGSQLFQGDFSDLSFSGFNPNYQIGVGDKIQIMIWGALENSLTLTVDAKGNIFIPKVGPVPIMGVRNEEIHSLISDRVREVYTDNIEIYANLISSQTVKVFVSGFVDQPGLYQGFASDSVLYFLDQAGGVDAMRGSYRDIQLVRSGKTEANIDLYDFLSTGKLPLSQFRDGDVILVKRRGPSITVTGDVHNPALFELSHSPASLSDALRLASPHAAATLVSVQQARNGVASAQLIPISQADSTTIGAGDSIDVSSRNIEQTILVSYTGEHQGEAKAVLKRGDTLAQAIEKIQPSALSNVNAISIFRESVARRQKQLLKQSLDNLERHVIGASSVSLEEAQLRQVESETILSFIERARQIEPKGQILLENLAQAETLHLEDGDIIHIPTISNLVTVYGEVKYPNTQTARKKDALLNYIERAGGFSDNANKKEIIIIRPNGLIEPVGKGKGATVVAGDEVIVLPKADGKGLLYAKEISTIIYQIALSARVAIGL